MEPIKSSGGEEANRECPDCHSRRIWKDGLRETKKYGSVQRFICRDCGHRFSESIVELNVVGKVGESFDSAENYHEVRVASGYASDEEVDNCLPLFKSENISSHDISIVEKSLYGFPFYNSKRQVCAQKDVKNLNTTTETKTVSGEEKQTTKEKILQFVLYLKLQEVYILLKNYTFYLNCCKFASAKKRMGCVCIQTSRENDANKSRGS